MTKKPMEEKKPMDHTIVSRQFFNFPSERKFTSKPGLYLNPITETHERS
jgi:hypothetical protein